MAVNAHVTRIRTARSSDREALKALDSNVPSDRSRAAAIDTWLARDEVFVAETDGVVTGYAVLRRGGFFDRDSLDMLMIQREHRGRRIGEALLRHVEALVATEQFFVTTNLSNHRMQRLLARLGYASCGFIGELDPGDPEIVFVKKDFTR